MMLQRKSWNPEEFATVNLPEVVGCIRNKKAFSQHRGTRVLDMPIYMPGQGWRISADLLFHVAEMLEYVAESEYRYGDFQDDHYVYVTVDQKEVEAGATGRRPGAHSDAYIEVDHQQVDLTSAQSATIASQFGEVSHTYICASSIPTEFFSVPFPLTDTSDAGSLKTFDEIANASSPVVYMPYTVLKLDPYVVHRCGIASHTHFRTFVKVSVSRARFARTGNTVNPAFDYDWELTARSPSERNAPWA